MKNEEKIVELLAESLKTQDKQADLLAKHNDLLIDQGSKIDLLVDVTKDMSNAINHLTNSVQTMLNKFDQINDHEKRIRSIERKLGL